MTPSRRSFCTAAVWVVGLSGLLLSGCAEVTEASPEVHQPAHLQPVKGTDLAKVSLDKAGTEQVSLKTAPVQAAGSRTAVPYAALLYDGEGTPWVYTRLATRTFMRVEVAVHEVVGSRVLLDDGPQVGIRVVTVGASEVYGAELEIDGGH